MISMKQQPARKKTCQSPGAKRERPVVAASSFVSGADATSKSNKGNGEPFASTAPIWGEKVPRTKSPTSGCNKSNGGNHSAQVLAAHEDELLPSTTTTTTPTTTTTRKGIKFQSSLLSNNFARRLAKHGHNGQVEDNNVHASSGQNDQRRQDDESSLDDLELKFARLALVFRGFMNFYGFVEDITLLLGSSFSRVDSNGEERNLRPKSKLARKVELYNEVFGKILCFTMIVFANVLIVYVLVAHFIWELRRLDVKMAIYERQRLVSAGQLATPPSAPSSFNGWSVLKDFLENLRRHLSRLFALALILIWHKNCHRFELLFLDCRRYYWAFYSAPSTSGSAAEPVEGDDERHSSMSSQFAALISVPQQQQLNVRRKQLLETTALKFYALANSRVWLAVCSNLGHLLFNVLAIFMFPTALVLTTSASKSQLEAQNLTSAGGQSAMPSDGHVKGALEGADKTLWEHLGRLFALALRNFNAFHLVIHTAFHPFDHQINPVENGTAPAGEGQQAAAERTVSLHRSAFYCLAEMFVHFVYIHGPRLMSSTCLSLILAIHNLCLQSFNGHLMDLIKRKRCEPLARSDMIKLLKQWDMIGLMHERIERAFKSSLVLWFGSMFISCLMQIFTLTETTSAAFSSTAAPGGSAGGGAQRADHQLADTSHGASLFLATLCPIAITLARIMMIVYAPWLVYVEAFKLESESARTNQLVVLLSRRRDDPIAQAIEPSLFEPICLSVGGYFSLSRKGVASLLGAIVTFSIMFIVEGQEESDDKSVDDDGGADAVVAPHTARATEIGHDARAEVANQHHGRAAVSAHGQARDQLLKARQWREFERLHGNSDDFVGKQDKRQSTYRNAYGAGRVTRTGSWRAHSAAKVPHLAEARHRLPDDTDTDGLQEGSGGPEETGELVGAPKLGQFYAAKVRENERTFSLLVPKLRVQNQVEVCDVDLELLPKGEEAQLSSSSTEPSEDLDDDSKIREAGRNKEPEAAGWNPFQVAWIDRIGGEISIEARDGALMNCEKQRNYTLRLQAIGCNGLRSNKAILRVELEDVNEFSPEFEHQIYQILFEVDPSKVSSWPPSGLSGEELRGSEDNKEEQSGDDEGDEWRQLAIVQAHDQDCNREHQGRVCSYELQGLDPQQAASVQLDLNGNLRAKRRWLEERSLKAAAEAATISQQAAEPSMLGQINFQVLAYDCAGKKSQRPASVQLKLARKCQAAWKDVDSRIVYVPQSGEKWPFLGAQLDLCSHRCSRPNVSVHLQLEAPPSPPGSSLHQQRSSSFSTLNNRPRDAQPSPSLAEAAPGPLSNSPTLSSGSSFHCDREPYAMVSKRRLCGSRKRAIELLPPFSVHTKWIGALLAPSSTGATSSLVGRRSSLSSHRSPKAPDTVSQAGDSNNNITETNNAVNDVPNTTAGTTNSRARQQADDQQQDEENLDAYSADGSYGRVANKFAANRLEVGSASRAPAGEDGLGSVGRAAARGAASRGGSGSLVPARGRSERPEPSGIYRDQVYTFDGNTNVVLVPRVVLLGSQNYSANAWTSRGPNGHHQVHHHLLPFLFGEQHTLSFWMRHAPFKFKQQLADQEADLDELARHAREHLICASEVQAPKHRARQQQQAVRGHHHHLHHYALFLRNCKLVLQIGANGSAASSGQQEAGDAEWRWSPSGGQLCDNKWHLYSINVNLATQRTELFVDGQQVEEAKKLAKGADKAKRQAESGRAPLSQAPLTLALGACWAPPAQADGHFRGALSGLVVLVNGNEDSQALECLGRCSEALVSNAPQKDDGTKEQAVGPAAKRTPPVDQSLVAYQESQSSITLHGHDLLDLEDALAQIAYVNRRQLPSIGRRTISMETSVQCSNISELSVGPVRVEIDVQPSSQLPVIALTGSWRNLAREYGPFQAGVPLFASVGLQVRRVQLPIASSVQAQDNVETQTKATSKFASDLLDYVEDFGASGESGEQAAQARAKPAAGHIELVDNLASIRHRIEACSIEVEAPALDHSHERLVLPLEQLEKLGLYWRSSQEGAIIYGLDSVANYEQLIAMILYQNEKPHLYSERSFKLHCSDMSGRLLSNEHKQTVTMIHLRPDPPADIGAQSGQQPQVAALRQSPLQHVNLTLDRPHTLIRETHRQHPAGAHGNQMIQWMGGSRTSELEPAYQTTTGRLNRIAMAFLVFVVSMIIIVLVIALTNLKETTDGIEQLDERQLLDRQRWRRRRRMRRHLGPSAHSMALENNNSVCKVPKDMVAFDEEPDSDESDSEGEFERGRNGGLDERDQRPRASDDDEFSSDEFMDDEETDIDVDDGGVRQGAVIKSTSDLESLAWDDELAQSATTIVMNPILHGQKVSADSDSQQQNITTRDEILVVAELQPNASSVSCRTLHLDRLQQRQNCRHKRRPRFDKRQRMETKDRSRSCSISPSSTSASTTTSASEASDNENNSGSNTACQHHHQFNIHHMHHHYHASEQAAPLEGQHDGQHYELFHGHHIHHACLRQQQSLAATNSATNVDRVRPDSPTTCPTTNELRHRGDRTSWQSD